MKGENMGLEIPEKVRHKDYGDGEVLKIKKDKIYVSFGGVQKIFVYPDAFEKGYLLAAIEIESSKDLLANDAGEPTPNDRKTINADLSKTETVKAFSSLAKNYGVLDEAKSGGGHDRFRLGKERQSKPLFLVCSRVGWMCVYIDENEKIVLENNGFPCVSTRDDENYDYRTRVNAADFDAFLKIVQKHLGR